VSLNQLPLLDIDRNVGEIRQPLEPEPSIITELTMDDFHLSADGSRERQAIWIVQHHCCRRRQTRLIFI